MSEEIVNDLRRELNKAHNVLSNVESYLRHHSEMNAALHCSDRVMYTPLHSQVQGILHNISHALSRTLPSQKEVNIMTKSDIENLS